MCTWDSAQPLFIMKIVKFKIKEFTDLWSHGFSLVTNVAGSVKILCTRIQKWGGHLGAECDLNIQIQ